MCVFSLFLGDGSYFLEVADNLGEEFGVVGIYDIVLFGTGIGETFFGGSKQGGGGVEDFYEDGVVTDQEHRFGVGINHVFAKHFFGCDFPRVVDLFNDVGDEVRMGGHLQSVVTAVPFCA